MKIKRKVSSNLGRTQHREADKHYKIIAKKIGFTKRCPFYNGNKFSQFNSSSHNILNPNFQNPNVPLEEFDFLKKRKEWSLQSYCKVCYKAYRDARIGKARSTWKNKNGKIMTDNEIRSWYRKNVGATMECSKCKEYLDPAMFRISKSMEKGLHNLCYDCESGSSISVREKQWLSDGDWESWSSIAKDLHRKKKVRCSGWSRSIGSGSCLIFDTGKNMHADHIIPLRAGGIHDAKNFQALCSKCNIKKSDQIDPATGISIIRNLVSRDYVSLINSNDSIETIERKLKAKLVQRIALFIKKGTYLLEIKKKKKEVNGQWKVDRAYKKGIDWFYRITARY